MIQVIKNIIKQIEHIETLHNQPLDVRIEWQENVHNKYSKIINAGCWIVK